MTALSVTALRLAAVETLCPTAALIADDGYPTLAGRSVFDSSMIEADDLAGDAQAKAAIGVFTEQVSAARRGVSAPSAPAWFTVDLVLETELAIVDQIGDDLTIGNPPTDKQAEMELDFMGAQIRRLFATAPEGALFRTICKAIERTEVSPLRVSELGLRLARRTMVLTCAIDDDDWTDAPGLPASLSNLYDELPDGSYAKAGLARIAAAIAPTVRTPLEEIRLGLSFDGTTPATPEDASIQASVDTQED